MKIKMNRLIASGLFSLLFLGECYLMLTVMNQYGTASLAVAHLAVMAALPILPVFAILIANPCFDRPAVKSAVLYAGVLYTAGCILFYNAASMLYATGLNSSTQTIGYYLVGGKAALVIIALLLAAYEPKQKSVEEPIETTAELPAPEETAVSEETPVTDCSEDTAAEISDEDAKKMGL